MVVGKVLFLSGGNSGIGFYMIKEWLAMGNHACVIDLSCDNIQELAEAHPERIMGIVCDVADKDAVSKAAKETHTRFGRIDFAVHNACLCLFNSFAAHTDADYERVMSVNFAGARNIARAVLSIMLSQKSGRIYFTSSGVGVTGFINVSSYAASKSAIEAFARCMNLEYSSTGVSFHILHPPLTDTKSSSPLPVPKEFKASPERVGRSFAQRLNSNRFIITPSLFDTLSVKMSYLFPLFMGKLLTKMTKRASGR
jgi:NAD(P)-dependent dehydrogenase (short-subunit alcohol dehydrogenase family)